LFEVLLLWVSVIPAGYASIVCGGDGGGEWGEVVRDRGQTGG